MTEEEKKRRGLKPNMSFGREVADTNGFDTATLREQPSEVIPTVSEQPAEPQTTATEQPQPSAYDRLMAAYEERQKKDERADKRNRIRTAIAGIGDTVGALGNLYFTTKYATPIPQTEGMSDKMRERYEAAKAKRDRNRAEWMNYALNIAGRKQAAEQAEANRQTTEKYHNAIIAQRDAAAKATAEAKAAAAEEKAAKDWAKGYAKQWEAAAIDGSLDYDATLKWIEDNAQSDAHKTAAINVLNGAVGNADTRTKYYKYQQENKVSNGGGRGNGGSKASTDTEIFTHVPGQKITLSKAAMNGTALPVSALPTEDGEIRKYIKAKQYKQAFEYFFNSNKYIETAKNEMVKKLIAARDAKEATAVQPTQQSGGKSLGIGVQSTKPAGKSLGINVKK